MEHAFRILRDTGGFYLYTPRLHNHKCLPVGLAGEFTSLQYTVACRYLHTIPLPIRLSFLKVKYSQYGGRYSTIESVHRYTNFILWYQVTMGHKPI
jgi:hypothetical protein